MADPVPVITRAHFEEAFVSARQSVSAQDLYKFEVFRQKMDPSYMKKQ
jgi:transitional endoplasmic reticulum ATPase